LIKYIDGSLEFFFAALVGFTLCGVSSLGAGEAAKAKEIQLAALALPSGAGADWRQSDSSAQ